jgi:hypothetical protein
MTEIKTLTSTRTVTITVSRNVQVRPYESAKVEITITEHLDDAETYDEAFNSLIDMATERLQEALTATAAAELQAQG